MILGLFVSTNITVRYRSFVGRVHVNTLTHFDGRLALPSRCFDQGRTLIPIIVLSVVANIRMDGSVGFCSSHILLAIAPSFSSWYVLNCSPSLAIYGEEERKENGSFGYGLQV